MNFSKSSECDICLLLEGTYPYVAGGVSSWVQQIIRGFPHLRFALVFLGSRAQDYGAPKYELPSNVVHAETHYLYEADAAPPPKARVGDAQRFEQVERLHEYFRLRGGDDRAVDAVLNDLHAGLSAEEFLYSEEAWHYIRRQFRRFCSDPSFVDYFWTVRTMHAPIWKLARIARDLPQARVYHTVSTGYAGFLAALAKRRHGGAVVLSEHGIYTKERKIDLFSAEWIADNRSSLQRDSAEVSYFRQMWIRFFEALGKLCYDAADEIVALYEVNRQRQIADGAQASRTQCVPNGVDVPRLSLLRAQRPAKIPPVLCLIGRVVPIKDVKTFIRAMHSVVLHLPEAQAWIAGPTEEDPDYARECEQLVESVGLKAHVRFLGFQKLTELLPQVGLVVLSSISEGLPLVILEAYAAGVPVVTTDVGACRQLVQGLGAEDEALGAAGRVVGIADPGALAQAAVELLGDENAWHAAAEAGMRRVENYYSDMLMFERYAEIYARALQASAPGARPLAPSTQGCPWQA